MRKPISRASSGRRVSSHLSCPRRAVSTASKEYNIVWEWVQGREWSCQLVTKEFTRSQGFIPIQSSSQVSSFVATWLGGRLLLASLSFLVQWILNSFLHTSTLTEYVLWLHFEGMGSSDWCHAWDHLSETLMGRPWILASWFMLAVVYMLSRTQGRRQYCKN